MRLFSVTETAERLGVTRRAIQKWITQGFFPNAYQLNPAATNSPYRIPEADIVAFEAKRMENREFTSPGAAA